MEIDFFLFKTDTKDNHTSASINNASINKFLRKEPFLRPIAYIDIVQYSNIEASIIIIPRLKSVRVRQGFYFFFYTRVSTTKRIYFPFLYPRQNSYRYKYIRRIRFSLSINIPSNLMSFIYILFLLCFVHTSLSTSI